MFGILWLTVWATVGEAFYDDYWYAPGNDRMDNNSFDSQGHLRQNFTDNLRTFANFYEAARVSDDEEMTLGKARALLRGIKLFEHTGSPLDFDPSMGRLLPLLKGEKFCSMGRHTKVDCNLCTCVAGQLYMCTGMICPQSTGRPSFLSTCREGKQRKIDACNYCYCRNGHEFCTNKDCKKEFNQGLGLRKQKCIDGHRRQKGCNRCLCFNGEDHCTRKHCHDDEEESVLLHGGFGSKKCHTGSTKQMGCKFCTCVARYWDCLPKRCARKNGIHHLRRGCQEGSVRQIDFCNFCFCRNGKEYCENKDCGMPDNKFDRLRDDTCIEGSRYKIDACNYCICRNGRETCTSNSCGDYALQRSRKSCESGTSKYISCNYCVCYSGHWSCTRLFCGDERENQGGDTCKPGETKLIECNTCQCHQGGWICTLLICASEEPDIKPKATYLEKKGSDETCNTGDSKRIECNTCHCFDGTWACTLSKCPDGEISKSNYDFRAMESTAVDFVVNANCARGEVKQENCVSCICAGNLWKCYNTCNVLDDDPNAPLRQVRRRECKRRDVKYEKCNRCECTANRWVCAQHKCDDDDQTSQESSGESKLKFYLQHCTNGIERKKDACNICFCRSNQWYCQMKKCTLSTENKVTKLDGMWDGLKPSYKPKCRKNSKRKIDACNSCYCRHGKWFCENKYCETPAEVTMFLKQNIPVLSNKCKTGHTKVFNCHRCVCYADGYKCTLRKKCRIDPIDGKPYLRTQCKIGTRYRMDACNYCYCNYNRKKICSNHSCPQYAKFSRAGFSCVIGRRDRIDACNYCYCNRYRQWICSNNSCPEVYEIYRRSRAESSGYTPCVSGVRRQIDTCNYCLCLNGTEYCTGKDCSHPPRLYFLEPPCYPGEVLLRPDPCNQCICLDSTVVCSKVPCEKRLQVAGDTRSHSCVEGERYNLDDGCNYCVCQGGHDFCTSRACLVNERPSSPNSVCNEGEMISADDNCNLCACVKGKVTCTDLDCSHGARQGTNSQYPYLRIRKDEDRLRFRNPSTNTINPVTNRCRPGVIYSSPDDNPDCPNSCICDANELLCTHRTCDNHWNHAGSSSGYSMSPKSAFNRYAKQLLKHEICVENQPLPSEDPCNSCICLNGKKVCTIIGCTDDIYGYVKPRFKGITGNMDAFKRHGPFCTPFTFFSPDSNRFCRNCFCLHNGLALCLLNLCKYSKDVPHNPPEHLQICTPGEKGYPTKCVSCTCSDQARWVCTREQLTDCNERNCDLRDEFEMGFQSFCAGCRCMSKEWYCEVKGDPCKDYSHVTCPMGALIINPNQYCSICLCGGYDNGSNNMCFTETKCVDQVMRHQ